MCGINAIFVYGDAPGVDRTELARVRDAMARRGPDGIGQWISASGRVGLGHRRLSIIDPNARSDQPMSSPDGKHVISYNGEIYNHEELRSELEREGYTFRTRSDTEVLLALYKKSGPAMVDRLRGMFAFILWDDDQQGLLLARDPLGIKPLYFADNGTTVRIASQVKALLVGAGIDRTSSVAGQCGFLVFGYVPEPYTLYRGIRELAAGTSLWIGTNGRRIERRHFDVRQILVDAEREAGDVDANDLRSLVEDTIRHHLVADVDVGVFLSAGIDSTTLTALVAETHRSDLRTVTLAFDDYRGRDDDEAPLAECVAAHYGTRHETRRIARTDLTDAFAQIVTAMDQPTIDGVNTWLVSRAAAGTGLKVAMSGVGGDELFAGYPSFRQVPRIARALAPLARVRFLGRALRTVVEPWADRLGRPKYAGVLEYGTSIPEAWLLRRALYMPWELPALVGSDIAEAGLAELALSDRLADTVRGLSSPRAAITALETCWYLRGQLLRDADWAGMAHSLEIRVPLVDSVLFRGLARLIVGRRPPGKRDLATLPASPLPEKIIARRKTGFTVPIKGWLAEGSPKSRWRNPYRSFAQRMIGAFGVNLPA